jgi:hypothetical protein
MPYFDADQLTAQLHTLDALGADAQDPVVLQLADAARAAGDAGRLQLAHLIALVGIVAGSRGYYTELLAGSCALRILKELGAVARAPGGQRDAE